MHACKSWKFIVELLLENNVSILLMQQPRPLKLNYVVTKWPSSTKDYLISSSIEQFLLIRPLYLYFIKQNSEISWSSPNQSTLQDQIYYTKFMLQNNIGYVPYNFDVVIIMAGLDTKVLLVNSVGVSSVCPCRQCLFFYQWSVSYWL